MTNYVIITTDTKDKEKRAWQNMYVQYVNGFTMKKLKG